MVFHERNFKKVDFEIKSADDKSHAKLICAKDIIFYTDRCIDRQTGLFSWSAVALDWESNGC